MLGQLRSREVPDHAEEFVRYRDAAVWQRHDAYYRERGLAAWDEIPSRSTNNHGLARQHVEVLLAAARAVDGPFVVLEVGAGGGRFAACLLDALAHDAGDAGRALLGRLRYVLSDFSEPTLRAAADGALRPHVASGRVVPALFDLRVDEPPRALAGSAAGPYAVVIANYIACVSPTAIVRRDARGWRELHARGRFDALEWEWRDAPGRLFDEPLHNAVLARAADASPGAALGYPFGFFDFLRAAARRLAPGGFVMVSDFGAPERTLAPESPEPRPRLYGASLNHAVQFALFDAFAEVAGWSLARTEAQLRALTHALVAPAPLAESVRAAFQRAFVERQDGADLLEFAAAARALNEAGDHVRAARLLARAVAIEPRSALMRYQLGETLIHADEPLRALEQLHTCRECDGAAELDVEFQLGAAYYKVRDPRRALAWLERSLARERHPATLLNVALAHRELGATKPAARALTQALELDPGYQPARDLLEAIKQDVWDRLLAD